MRPEKNTAGIFLHLQFTAMNNVLTISFYSVSFHSFIIFLYHLIYSPITPAYTLSENFLYYI